MDVEPETLPAGGSGIPETFYSDECFWTVAGVADIFGADAVSRAFVYGGPLKLYRSPWQLLLAASEDEFIYLGESPGAVLLNRELSCWAALSHFRELHAEDRVHAIELRHFIKAAGAEPPPIKFPEKIEDREAA